MSDTNFFDDSRTDNTPAPATIDPEIGKKLRAQTDAHVADSVAAIKRNNDKTPTPEDEAFGFAAKVNASRGKSQGHSR